MPRKNSTAWAAGNPILGTRLEAFNTDIDDLYATGPDGLKVYHLSAQPALQVTIGAGNYRVGGTEGNYAGGTLTVGASVTTYIMINSGGVIQTSTTAWNGQYARLAVVVSGASTITSITDWRNNTVGGEIGGNPTGAILMWPTTSSPTGYLLCDGTAVSRSTYAGLFSLISTTFGSGDGSTTFNLPNFTGRTAIGRLDATSLGTTTMTIASPCVVTKASHGLANGNKVYFTTTGALPTGLTASTEYYVVNATSGTFQISLTLGGTAINTSGTQSGTHTLYSANFHSIGGKGGEVNHTLLESELPSHTHTIAVSGSSVSGGGGYLTQSNSTSGNINTGTGSGQGLTANNLPPYLVVNYIIKT